MKKQSPQSSTKNFNFQTILLLGTFAFLFFAIAYRLLEKSNEMPALKMSDETDNKILDFPTLSEKVTLPLNDASTIQSEPCQKKLLLLKNNSKLPAWASQYKIKFDPRISANIQDINQVRKNCQQALETIINDSSSFFPNVLSEPLEVVLIPVSLAHDESSFGVYDTKTTTIAIVYRDGLTVEECRQALLNEYFAHQVYTSNHINKIKNNKGHVFPGKANENNLKILQQNLNNHIEAITNKYILLHKKNLTAQEKIELNEFLEIAVEYTPRFYYSSERDLKLAVQSGELKVNKEGKVSPGSKYPANIPGVYGRKFTDGYSYSYAKDGMAASKATALFYDLQMVKHAINSDEGPYFATSEENKITELASFFAEISPNVQKKLFGSYYDSMCDFFTADSQSSRDRKKPSKS